MGRPAILTVPLAIVAVAMATPSPAHAQPDELDLPADAAFSIGTDIEVVDVRSVDPGPFNAIFRDAQDHGAEWSTNFVQIGLRFSECPPQGRRQEVTVEVPGEWEPGGPLRWARVTVYNGGWLDDAVSGERHVIWVGSDAAGRWEVRRALWARLCRRPNRVLWSSRPCP